ncbi:MAG: TIGR00730 family Rossman fold protein [Oscillospiraceae bacterium]|nr:TIGR00730 family Rossman fold protein [Oscillospiraceae bacterium]MBR6208590.1 TIGR00730 family Rossman fold protein [Oscillospiraceae bacterium]
MTICVFGAARDDIAPAYFALGEDLGRELARRGHSLVFGGGAHGLMGAVARGAAAQGGEITGVAPHFFRRPGVLFEGCTRMLHMDTMAERKSIMRQMSEAFIALPGGLGTMEEVLEVLTLRLLGQLSKPVALLDAENYWQSAVDMIASSVEKGFAGPETLSAFGRFTDSGACLDYLERESGYDL